MTSHATQATPDADATSAPQQGSADIGLTGLATMGANLARNMARRGHTVAVHNRTVQRTRILLDEHADEGTFVPTESLEEFVAAIRRPRAIVVMVKAGSGTDEVIDALLPLLDEGDIVADAGNAHFEDTLRRQQALDEHGIHFVGMGVSGGEVGALEGPSIMVGGSDHAYERLGPVVESIAASVDGVPCAAHVGPGGAGHYVKMVHNGIEYAVMQLLGEAYDLLRSALGWEPARIGATFREWQRGELGSFLLERAADVLEHTDARTGGPFVDVVADAAEQKGTGRWTVQSALDLGVPVPAISEAVIARSLSGQVDWRWAVGSALPPPTPPTTGAPVVGEAAFVTDLREAVLAASATAYAEGLDQIAAASAAYDWGVSLYDVATIWRDGCIIRARLLDPLREAIGGRQELPTVLVSEPVVRLVTAGDAGWRRTVSAAVERGVPVPVLAGALTALDSLRRDRLPAALIQGLRDDFGAHTYQRVDVEGTFHTRWAGDLGEEERG